MFHECGHATACRYGGARPGQIGVGLYLVWPSFFTNVTDSYRLSRAGRLSTDLGGVYFNLVFVLAMAAIYEATSAAILPVVIALSHLEMLEQLLPFVRFDGYFIVGDLIGVPDLFTRTAGLRLRSRILVTGWTVCALGFLTLTIGYLLLRFPDINRPCGTPRASRHGSWRCRLVPGTTRRQRLTRSVPRSRPCPSAPRCTSSSRSRAGRSPSACAGQAAASAVACSPWPPPLPA